MLKKKNILISMIVFIIIFSFINEVTSFYYSLKKEKQDFYENSKKVYNTIIDQQSRSIKSVALLLANDETIKEAYFYNDPELLKHYLLSYWKEVKKDNLIYEIHFFKPPAESFVNFSNFSSIGKDVSDVRKDIKWVTTSFKSSSHIMMCKTYAGIRGTYPIIDNKGKILGGLSLGKKIDWLPNTIKRLTSSDAFLVYSKTSTKTLGGKYYKQFMKDKEIIGKYILANKTLAIPKEAFAKINFSQKIQDINIHNKKYSLNLFRINDFENHLLAYVCTLDDLDNFYTKFYTKTINNIILFLIAGFFVYLVLRTKINKTLNEIKSILHITNDIKNNNFHNLISYNSHISKNSDNALKNLESNIVSMGKTIKEQLDNKDSLVAKQAKMASLGEMLDYISHQWRQPLSAISTNASGMKIQKEHDLLTIKQENIMLDNIVNTCEYLSQTIDDFRRFLKEDKIYKKFTIKNAFNKTKFLTQSTLKDNKITVIEEIEEIVISGIENELVQVFINFIMNTKDAFSSLDDLDEKYIFIKVYKNKRNKIVIEFKDNAGGMNSDILNKVFDSNFTTKANRGGTGIGLYMSKQIIENSFHGTIIVKNIEYTYNNSKFKGAVFTVTID